MLTERIEPFGIEQADKQYETLETSYRDFADKINQWIKTKEFHSKSDRAETTA
jgi:hypothetical protein